MIAPWMQRAFDKCESCALDDVDDQRRLARALEEEMPKCVTCAPCECDGTGYVMIAWVRRLQDARHRMAYCACAEGDRKRAEYAVPVGRR